MSGHIKSTRAPIASASFHLRARCGIGGFKRRFRPRGAASGDAKEREQDEENANCSPIVGHRSPIRVSQLAARKRRDYATILTKINRPSPASGPRRCSSRRCGAQIIEPIDHAMRQRDERAAFPVRGAHQRSILWERRLDCGEGIPTVIRPFRWP